MSETEQLDDVNFISEVMDAREELENARNADSVTELAKENDGTYPRRFDVLYSIIIPSQ